MAYYLIRLYRRWQLAHDGVLPPITTAEWIALSPGGVPAPAGAARRPVSAR